MLMILVLTACLAYENRARRVQNTVAHIVASHEAPSQLFEGSHASHADAAVPTEDGVKQAAPEDSWRGIREKLGIIVLALRPSSLPSLPSDFGAVSSSSQTPAVAHSSSDASIPHVMASLDKDIGARVWRNRPTHLYVPGMMQRSGALSMSLSSISTMSMTIASATTETFNYLLYGLVGVAAIWRLYGARKAGTTSDTNTKPEHVRSLQFRFLIVFWLLRMADWLQGPYFYEVYRSKIFGGVQASLDLVSVIFLVGFLSRGIFGPFVGKLVDGSGRKAGTLAFAVLCSLAALSTFSSSLSVIMLGRVAGGIATSLLFSAPEAWLVGEYRQQAFDGMWLGQTFAWAYAGDAVVAILAGQFASASASGLGPTGPFALSVVFLITAAFLAAFTWTENTAASVATITGESESSQDEKTKPSVADACNLMFKDTRILLLGAVQALFEGAMYIFVLQWAPAMTAAIEVLSGYGAETTPYGTIFSCFMTCYLLGSSAFGSLQSKQVSIEKSTLVMLLIATLAMIAATYTSMAAASLSVLIAAFFVFEGCVGMYFPSIGSLRSRYLPDRYRSVLINVFGIPLNLIVIAVFLFIGKLGVSGALFCSSCALGLATLCMWLLQNTAEELA